MGVVLGSTFVGRMSSGGGEWFALFVALLDELLVVLVLLNMTMRAKPEKPSADDLRGGGRYLASMSATAVSISCFVRDIKSDVLISDISPIAGPPGLDVRNGKATTRLAPF